MIDGYYIGILFYSEDVKSEMLARSIATDFSSQVNNTDTQKPEMSVEGKNEIVNQALSEGLLAGFKTFLIGTILFAAFRALKNLFSKKSNVEKSENNTPIATESKQTITDDLKQTDDSKQIDLEIENDKIGKGEGICKVPEENEIRVGNETIEVVETTKNENGECTQSDLHEKKNNEFESDNQSNEQPPYQAEDALKYKQEFASSSKIKFCRKCGTQLDEGVVFCRKCGTKVGE